MAYEAIICKVFTREHPSADRLKLGTANGHQVVVGLDTANGELGIYFPTDGRLSPEFASANNLVRKRDPESGINIGGMFDDNRKVRAQRLRGEKSDGFWTTLDSLTFTGVNLETFKEGDTFTEVSGTLICEKYYTPATMRAMQRSKGKKPKANKCFAKHVDTEQFRFVREFPQGSIIHLSEKVHGTSARTGLLLTDGDIERPLNWFQRRLYSLLRRSTVKPREWAVITGTRNTVIREGSVGFYANEDFRTDATESFCNLLHKGEIVYYEILGYTTDGQLIMGAQDTKSLKDKSILKRYGPVMTYSYGTEPGQYAIRVYRITQVNEDGFAVDLSVEQIKARCKELDLEYVPEIISPFVWDKTRNFFGPDDEGVFTCFASLVSNLVEGNSLIDPRHIREGVVIRVDNEYGTSFYKEKSFAFKVLEGIAKDQDDYVDAEEIA